eukprot:m.11575 g.11575  ORF g.11575 m.11575 type:complete len:292 (-) comp8882_c0_seq1:338-1213(-)
MHSLRGIVRAASTWPSATLQGATNTIRTLVPQQGTSNNPFVKFAAALTASAGAAAYLLGVTDTRNEGQSSGRWDRDWDRMEHTAATAKAKAKSKTATPSKPAARYLVLVRHGQYNSNEIRDLTELGRLQADVTGQRLAELGIKFNQIHCSDITRAEQTCEIISKHLPGTPVSKTILLREGAPCEPEPAHSTWKPDPEEFFRDGARIEAGFREFFHRATPDVDEDSYELLVCHGNVIRYSVLRALQLPPEAWLRLAHANCGITTIRISASGSVSLEAFGDKGHLKPTEITYN